MSSTFLVKLPSALLKPAFAAAFIGASLCALAPAHASILVDPRIRQSNESAPSTNASENIVGIAGSTDEFSTLFAAVEAANLGSILSGEGPFTVFAPTDAAFAALPAGALDALLMPENRDLLVKVLYNHVGYGSFTSDSLNSGEFQTFDGTVSVDVEPTGVTVDGASVIQADVAATNGVVHAVDQVLLPLGFTEQLQARLSGNSSTASSSSSSSSSSSLSTSSSSSVRRSTLQQTVIERPTTPVAAPVQRPAPQPAPAVQEPVRGLW